MSDTNAEIVRLREAVVHQLVAPDLPLDDDEWSRGYRQAFWWVLHRIDHPLENDGAEIGTWTEQSDGSSDG